MRAVIVSALVAVLVIGAALWARQEVIEDQREHCAGLDAELVRTGQGHYLCIGRDGRIVWP